MSSGIGSGSGSAGASASFFAAMRFKRFEDQEKRKGRNQESDDGLDKVSVRYRSVSDSQRK